MPIVTPEMKAMESRIDGPADAPAVYRAMFGLHAAVGEAAIDKRLRHLIDLRVSQINGCSFCVLMHAAEARAAGEAEARLDGVAVWWSVPAFTPAERAALAWAEALTRLDPATDWDGLHATLAAHYDAAQVAALTGIAAHINAWNRLGVGAHGERRPG